MGKIHMGPPPPVEQSDWQQTQLKTLPSHTLRSAGSNYGIQMAFHFHSDSIILSKILNISKYLNSQWFIATAYQIVLYFMARKDFFLVYKTNLSVL